MTSTTQILIGICIAAMGALSLIAGVINSEGLVSAMDRRIPFNFMSTPVRRVALAVMGLLLLFGGIMVILNP